MKRLFAMLLISCLMLCGGCSRIAFLPQEDANLQPTYVKACDLLKEGKLEEAYPLFLSLGDYKDSALHASKFTYLPTEIMAQDDGFGESMALYKTTYSYNEKGQLLEGKGAYTKEEGPGYSETHTYNENGRLTQSKFLSEAGDSTVTYQYNDQGQCLKEIGFTEGANVGGITLFTYENGLRKTATVRSYLGTDTAAYETEEAYHQSTVTYTYNDQGLCTKAEENTGENGTFTYTVSYNEFGLPTLLRHTDSQGFESMTVFEYDKQGRCTKVDTDYDTTEFTYGDHANPLSATRTRDGGKPCQVTYTYQLFYLNEVPQIPAHLAEYLSGLEV